MIISKPYKNNLLKRIGVQLKTAREQAGLDIDRAVKLTQHKREFLLGIEAGDAETFLKLKVEKMLYLFALYGKEMVVSSHELPQEQRYFNLQFYSTRELQKFLQQDQNITY